MLNQMPWIGSPPALTTRIQLSTLTPAAKMPEMTLTTGMGRLSLRKFPWALLFVLVAAGTLPAQETAMPASSSVSSYRVRAGDLLRLRIWMGQNDAPISADIPVEESGQVFVPRVGAVQVAGKTVEELRETLRN